MKPNPILSFFIVFIRVFIFIKIISLLVLTSIWSEIHPISELTWWIYFLVFDIWVMSMIPTAEEIKMSQENKEDED